MNSSAEAICQDSLPDQEKGSLPACWEAAVGLYKYTSGEDLHVLTKGKSLGLLLDKFPPVKQQECRHCWGRSADVG